MKITYQNHKDFIKEAPKEWYGIGRAYTLFYETNSPLNEIFIDQDAFYFNERDKELVLKHEIGHTEGLNHTPTGLMSDNGFIRYLTTKL